MTLAKADSRVIPGNRPQDRADRPILKALDYFLNLML